MWVSCIWWLMEVVELVESRCMSWDVGTLFFSCDQNSAVPPEYFSCHSCLLLLASSLLGCPTMFSDTISLVDVSVPKMTSAVSAMMLPYFDSSCWFPNISNVYSTGPSFEWVCDGSGRMLASTELSVMGIRSMVPAARCCLSCDERNRGTGAESWAPSTLMSDRETFWSISELLSTWMVYLGRSTPCSLWSRM